MNLRMSEGLQLKSRGFLLKAGRGGAAPLGSPGLTLKQKR
jgi:hypothetical protein